MIEEQDILIGFITNIASAHGTYNNLPVDSPEVSATININPMPDISLTKTATPTTYTNVGDVVTYTYNVTNTGNVFINGITVIDDKLGTITLPVSYLTIGESIQGTATHTITTADVTAGSITNTATAEGVSPSFGTIVNSVATATVDLVAQPSLSITKAANPTTYTNVGDVITYTYNVTNTGNIPIAGPITVNDDKLGTITLSTSDLALGSSVQGTANYTITSADITAGSITNTATAHGNTEGLVPPTTTATVTYAAPPSYNLSIQDDSGVPQTSFGSGDNVHAIFTTTDTSLTQVTYVWKDPNGDIVNTDTVSITANTVSIYNPVTTGSWIVEVYPNTATTGTSLVNGTFNVAVPEFALAFAPLLLVGAVYVFMRRKYNK